VIVPGAAAVLVVVELHLVVPSVAWRFGLARVDRVYCYLTVLVAALATVTAVAARLPIGPVVSRWDPLMAMAAVVAGSAFPLVVILLTGRRPVRRSSHKPPPPAVLWIVGAATAEELLWRVLAPAAGQAVGWHPVVAMAAALCGFLLLHVPKFGFRRLPYLAGAGLLFTGCALVGGLLAAAAAHASHNLVIDLGGTVARRRVDQAGVTGLIR
jgi:membrane protease YdiL (CAAX protease family)